MRQALRSIFFENISAAISAKSTKASSIVIPHRLAYHAVIPALRRSCSLFPTLWKGWLRRVVSPCAALCGLLCSSFCSFSLHFLRRCPPRFFLILVRFPFVRLSLRAIVATPVVSLSLSLSLSLCLSLSLFSRQFSSFPTLFLHLIFHISSRKTEERRAREEPEQGGWPWRRLQRRAGFHATEQQLTQR